MRPPHCTITPAVVRTTARALLAAALPWRPYGRRVPVPRLLDLLLLAAALNRSLSAVCARFAFGFGRETARKAVAANLPDLGPLTAGLVDALHRSGGRPWRRRRWDVALDLHYRPFYGDRATPGVVGGQKKQGTHFFWGYATAVLIHRRWRYTVGLRPLARGPVHPDAIVAALLDQVAARGLRLRGVVLDAGFDSADTLRLLQRRGLSYAVPLRRKGTGGNGRNDWFAAPVGTVARRGWRGKRRSRRWVATWTAARRGDDGRAQVLAFGGWGRGRARAALARRARQAGRKYEQRFGIETSYRQLGEAMGATTKRGAGYRLLVVGVALLLRQVWVWLTGQVARAWELRDTAWVGALPLADVVEWLAWALERTYRKNRAVVWGRPLDPLPAP